MLITMEVLSEMEPGPEEVEELTWVEEVLLTAGVVVEVLLMLVELEEPPRLLE